MMNIDPEQLIVPQPLAPPYALFVGDIVGWKTQASDSPGAQVILCREPASLGDAMEFLGMGMSKFTGHQIEGQDVAVYAKIPFPGMRLGTNMIATWLLEMEAPMVFMGPVVICNGTDLS